MEQRAHTWIAIRAIALLEDTKAEKNLVDLLKPHAKKASVGAWIPDQADAKRGGAGSSTDNHVLKMMPYKGDQESRFVTKKENLLKKLGPHRAVTRFLQEDTTLDSKWWDTPFKGHVPKPGQHLPNRIMALGTMMKDLLLLGDQKVDDLIPGAISFADYLEPKARTTSAAASMYFFMLSHFVADVSMPCHSDGRKVAAYEAGLHKELERHWAKKVGVAFEKKELEKHSASPDQTLQLARDVDKAFGIDFQRAAIPSLGKDQDLWLEMINLCRGSFALASVIVPYKKYPYGSKKAKISFKDVFADGDLLSKTNRIALYDAVLNTAIVWKEIWNKVSKI